jgi:hypothetical protein
MRTKRITRIEQVNAFPLCWPQGKERTNGHDLIGNRRGWTTDFRTNMIKLENELARWEIHNWILSSGLRPHARATANLDEPGAALWYLAPSAATDGWVLSVLACDRFDRLALNVMAISLTLTRMRLIAEYGAYTAEQAMAGAAYVALPAPARDWHEVLKVGADTPLAVAEAAYHALAKTAHPDKGGSVQAMNVLNEAIEEARRIHIP